MYKLEFLTSAKKEFKRLNLPAQKLLKDKLIKLSQNPDNFKNNIKALKGKHQGKFRFRVGEYRIIIKKEDKKLIILIVSIGHRKDIYK